MGGQMTDRELINEMEDAIGELNRQAADLELKPQQLRLTMRLTARLIEKWVDEIPGED